jgi:hypothetical protein
MEYTLTQHARNALTKRKITLEWLERTLANPTLIEPDLIDRTLERRLAAIAEHGIACVG